jgi:hypothetical protein
VVLPRLEVGSRDWTAALADHFSAEPSRTVRKLGPTLLREIKPRDRFPLIDQIRADLAGNLWVRTFDNYGTPVATWVIFSPQGTPIALAATRRSLNVLEIGKDYLIGSRRDDDGVELVDLYTFPPFAGRSSLNSLRRPPQ